MYATEWQNIFHHLQHCTCVLHNMHQALNEADKDFQTQYLILEVQIVHIQQSLHHQEHIWHNHEEDLQ